MSINTQDLEATILKAWELRSEITPRTATPEVREAVNEALALLDSGRMRAAEPVGDSWKVNQWLKMAVLLSFRLEDNRLISGEASNYYDKIGLKFADYNNQIN